MITEKQFLEQLRSLLFGLKSDISDDYRCSDDPEDETPGMCVTIGATLTGEGENARVESWNYQTGDNSFSGGAYCHAIWGVGYLHRDSSCLDIASDILDEIFEQAYS